MSRGVEVNECHIFASQHGADWWTQWRALAERGGRPLQVVTPSLGGDRVWLPFDNADDARWFAALAIEKGCPKGAVKVRLR